MQLRPPWLFRPTPPTRCPLRTFVHLGIGCPVGSADRVCLRRHPRVDDERSTSGDALASCSCRSRVGQVLLGGISALKRLPFCWTSLPDRAGRRGHNASQPPVGGHDPPVTKPRSVGTSSCDVGTTTRFKEPSHRFFTQQGTDQARLLNHPSQPPRAAISHPPPGFAVTSE